ncbi:MAG TPA: hypothetical protein VKQ52_02780 [Puia sp.]|nr:hypothetical protein [Puia sp.]
MNKALAVAILLLAGLGLYVYNSRRGEVKKPPPPPPPDDIADRISRDKVRAVVEKYFESLEADMEQFNIHILYSFQFDLQDLKQPYARQVQPIASLTQLGLSAAEARAGKAVLIEKARAIIQGRPLDWGSSLIFLLDLSNIQSRLSALQKLYARITDKPGADSQIQKLRQAKEELISRYRTV